MAARGGPAVRVEPTSRAELRTKYAPEKIRSFAFSMYYVVMNLGAFVAGRLVSSLRIGLLGRALRR